MPGSDDRTDVVVVAVQVLHHPLTRGGARSRRDDRVGSRPASSCVVPIDWSVHDDVPVHLVHDSESRRPTVDGHLAQMLAATRHDGDRNGGGSLDDRSLVIGSQDVVAVGVSLRNVVRIVRTLVQRAAVIVVETRQRHRRMVRVVVVVGREGVIEDGGWRHVASRVLV